jgi:hypothetical protein
MQVSALVSLVVGNSSSVLQCVTSGVQGCENLGVLEFVVHKWSLS